MISRRRFAAASALAAFYGACIPARAGNDSLAWRNWSGALLAHPAGRFAPASEEELVTWLSSTTGPVRPVGAGHSFNPLVPTDGHLVIVDKMAGLLDHNSAGNRATFAAGTRLSSMGPALEAIGQGPMILPDIDRQTLAGAVSTGTHGTGETLHSMSGYVTGMRLVTSGGEVLDLDPATSHDLFQAACVSVGALGIITRIEMQNRQAYRLKARTLIQRTQEARRPHRAQHTQAAAKTEQQEALGEQLAHQTAATRADRQAHRDLAPA